MAALNPITSKALTGKLGSMQMLLLTAMTLLGFYLCFKEIRRITVEMAALRDQVSEDVAAAAGAAAAAAAKRGASAAPAVPDPMPAPADEAAAFDEENDDAEGGVVVVMDEAVDEMMDEGLRQMLEQLQNAVPQPPPPAVAEVEEVVELSREALAAKTKAEIEELLREHGVPFKKSDAKAKLIDALLEALDASGDGEHGGEDEGAVGDNNVTLEQAVAADDK